MTLASMMTFFYFVLKNVDLNLYSFYLDLSKYENALHSFAKDLYNDLYNLDLDLQYTTTVYPRVFEATKELMKCRLDNISKGFYTIIGKSQFNCKHVLI